MISWSFSRLTDYETCPYRFKLKYLDKHKEETSEAATRGIDHHNALEQYVLRYSEEYPAKYLKETIDQLRDKNPIIEDKWGFTPQWELCDWYSAWVRIIPDAYYMENETLTIIDFKTGKTNPIKHTAQGQLYVIGGFNKFPINQIKTEFYYLDNGEILTASYKREQLTTLQKNWNLRAERLTTTRSWNPKPNKWSCKYCGVKQHCDFEYEK